MRVALRAIHRQTEKRLAHGVYAINQTFDAKLFGINGAFLVAHRIAQKSRGDFLIECRIGQQVSGQLLDGELIERHVLIHCLDDPITIRPNRARLIFFKSVRVGITRYVKPVPPPLFAVMRRS